MGPKNPKQHRSLPLENRHQRQQISTSTCTSAYQLGHGGSIPLPPLSWYASISTMPPKSTILATTALDSSLVSTTRLPDALSFPARIPVHAASPYSAPASNGRVISDEVHSPRRKQSIPISFLVNSTPESPRPFGSFDFPSPIPSPSSFSPIPSSASRLQSAEQLLYHFDSPAQSPLTTNTPLTPLPERASTLDASGAKRRPVEDQLEITPHRAIRTRSAALSESVLKTAASSSTERVISSPGQAARDRRSTICTQQTNEATQRSRSISLRRTTNPELKTTKTGKIQHKSRKIGVSKRSTAYNRFLQQQSKDLAKHHSELTPQERMRQIAEAWAVSEKNTHTTRRKSRFLTTDNHESLPSVPLPVTLCTSAESMALREKDEIAVGRLSVSEVTPPTPTTRHFDQHQGPADTQGYSKY